MGPDSPEGHRRPEARLASLVRQAKSNIDDELTPERWRERDEACQRASASSATCCGGEPGRRRRLRRRPARAVPRRQPARRSQSTTATRFAVVRAARPQPESLSRRRRAALGPRPLPQYDTARGPGPAPHRALAADEFDIARTNRLRAERRHRPRVQLPLPAHLAGGTVPIVPVMINTYFPPNQPTPAALLHARQGASGEPIESWDGDAPRGGHGLRRAQPRHHRRGGRRITLDALLRRTRERLSRCRASKLLGGTSEILNWVALAGAVEPLEMPLVDYVPTYRSPGGTGCGMTFAYWR